MVAIVDDYTDHLKVSSNFHLLIAFWLARVILFFYGIGLE